MDISMQKAAVVAMDTITDTTMNHVAQRNLAVMGMAAVAVVNSLLIK
jgi:hypothetical protein